MRAYSGCMANVIGTALSATAIVKGNTQAMAAQVADLGDLVAKIALGGPQS